MRGLHVEARHIVMQAAGCWHRAPCPDPPTLPYLHAL